MSNLFLNSALVWLGGGGGGEMTSKNAGVCFISRNYVVRKLSHCMCYVRPISTRQKVVLFFGFFDVGSLLTYCKRGGSFTCLSHYLERSSFVVFMRFASKHLKSNKKGSYLTFDRFSNEVT